MKPIKNFKFYVQLIISASFMYAGFVAAGTVFNFVQIITELLRIAVNDGMSPEFQLIFGFGFIYLMVNFTSILIGLSIKLYRSAKFDNKPPLKNSPRLPL